MTDCDVTVNAKLPYLNDSRNHTYLLFDPTHQQPWRQTLRYPDYWNASTTGDTVIDSSPIGISVFDASLPFNVTDLLSNCGNPSPYYSFWQTISTKTRIFLSAGITAMDNKVDMVPKQDNLPSSEACSAGLAAKSSYDYFTPVLQTFDSGQQCDSSAATKDDRGYLVLTCWLNLYVSLQSTLATTQSSSRGTSTLKILIDEGSIVGGIMFFTWFLTIFL
ncbi:hypothetical protein LTR86_002003 [Recurvomyces mirabilis]|nr:hypothetical protein LTR86_002003 [Recurvomyces mirabilis]